MEWNFLFFFNSGLLGVGLAMDAFSVSMANGLHDPKMSVRRMCIIAGMVISYAGIVYSLLVEMGILSVDVLRLGSLPLTSLIFAVVPPLFFILGFGIMIANSNSGK